MASAAHDEAPLQRFAYRARDATGQSVAGAVQARDDVEAVRDLMRRGLTPLHLEPQDGAAASDAAVARPIRARPTLSDRIVFLQELSTLLGAGIPLGEAMPSLARAYARQALGAPIERADLAVKGGQRLADALRRCGLELPPHVLTLIEAGEASGTVAAACADAARQLEGERVFLQELRNALIYPAVLVVSGLLAVLVIFVGVVPRFAALLRGSRAEVPALSRAVIESGVYVQQHLGAFGMGLAALALLGAALWSQAAIRRALVQGATRLPGIGPWLVEAELARWATLLGTLLANRVGIAEALRLAASLLGIDSLRRSLGDAARELERGRALSEVLQTLPWFPPTRVNLVRVGERSGQLPKMLLELGRMQTDASRTRQRRLLALIEPLAILVIGAVIGFLMVAVMMAITSLNTAVG